MRLASTPAAMLTAAFSLLLSAAFSHAHSETACPEADALKSGVAPRADVSAMFSEPPRAGAAIPVNWQVSNLEGIPARTPVYLVITFPEAVRFEVRSEDLQLHLGPDFIALPAETRGPRDIRLGSGRTRAFIPLKSTSDRSPRTMLVKSYRAGPFTIEWAIVAKPACSSDELVLSHVEKLETTIFPGGAQVVIEEAVPDTVPDRVIRANTGRYELQVFKSTYKVIDLETHEKLIERSGWFPNFSPNARFVAAQIGSDRRGTPPLEVIDLMTGEPIQTGLIANELGWVEGDAFMISGNYPYGELFVRQSLIDMPEKDDRGRLGTFVIGNIGGNNSNNSWMHHSFWLDLDSGLLLIRYASPDREWDSPTRIVSLSRGQGIELRDKDTQQDQEAKWARLTDRPYVLPRGWQNHEGIKLSHIDPVQDDLVRKWYPGATWVAQQDVAEFHVAAGEPIKVASSSSGAGGVKVAKGDWRGIRVAGTERLIAAGLPERFTDAIADFGVPIRFATKPVSLIQRLDFEIRTGREVLVRPKFVKSPAKLEADFRRKFPALGKIMYHRAEKDADWCNTSPNIDHGFDFARDTVGLWQWSSGKTTFWFLQNLCLYKGFVAYNRLFLLSQSQHGTAVRELKRVEQQMTDAKSAEYSSDSNSFKWDEHALKVVPSIVEDRYLILTSVYGANAHVIDLAQPNLPSAAAAIQNADAVAASYFDPKSRHLVQLLANGQFYLYPLSLFRAEATGPIEANPEAKAPSADVTARKEEPLARATLFGRYADDEIILYDAKGCYWSSHEGAYFVKLKFAGQSGLNSFHQFRTKRENPGAVQAVLKGQASTCPDEALQTPPAVDIQLRDVAFDHLTLDTVSFASSGLQEIRIYEDGQLAASQSLTGTTALAEIRVPRFKGSRWITAAVVDRSGFVSRPASIEVKPSEPIGPHLAALAIGVDRYIDPRLSRLRFAAADAGLFERTLKEGVGSYYGDADVLALRDREASLEAITDHLKDMVSEAQPGDTLAIFFSGHGVRDETGELFLALSNTEVDKLATTALRWRDVAAILSRSRARVLVFVDACHAGAAVSTDAVTNEHSVQDFLAHMRAPVLVFASSKGRQTSKESDVLKGGLFTSAIAEVLGPSRDRFDTNGNGVLEASEIYMGVKSLVTSRSGGEQTPWLVRSDLLGDFTLF